MAIGMLVGCTAMKSPSPQERIASRIPNLESLSPQDRKAVSTGWPQEGMSTATLRALWGDPYYTTGRTGHYEQWTYRGSAMSLGTHGNASNELGTIVVVEIVDGRVLGWTETTPTGLESGGEENRRQ
jgi:hypothetical protein